MTRAEKARRIQAILDELYPETPIPLEHSDPYTLLVAVLLSAQTTDAMVNRVTPALFAHAATPAAMARTSVATIQQFIRTCGLAPSKARNIRAMAIDLVDDHGGRVPRTFAELEALPGVGHKTASVVMAQAFGEPAFPVDTHIHRLAGRWRLSDASTVERTEADLKKVIAIDRWGRVHLQMIFFGRQHCPALRHDMATCPICSWAATKKAIRAGLRPRPAAGAVSQGARRARRSPRAADRRRAAR